MNECLYIPVAGNERKGRKKNIRWTARAFLLAWQVTDLPERAECTPKADLPLSLNECALLSPVAGPNKVRDSKRVTKEHTQLVRITHRLFS